MENAVNPVGFKATQLLDSATIGNIARAYALAKNSCLATSIVWSSQGLGRSRYPSLRSVPCIVASFCG
jgi:hypothetical protein